MTIAVQKISGQEGQSRSYLWETLVNSGGNDVGAAIEVPDHADASVQFSGTFDSATAVLQGSNDNVTFFTVNDPLGNAISMTANGFFQIGDVARYYRPSTSGGGASQDIDCHLHMRQNR